MKRDWIMMVLNDDSDILYGGTRWTCMVNILTSKSVQDSR